MWLYVIDTDYITDTPEIMFQGTLDEVIAWIKSNPLRYLYNRHIAQKLEI